METVKYNFNITESAKLYTSLLGMKGTGKGIQAHKILRHQVGEKIDALFPELGNKEILVDDFPKEDDRRELELSRRHLTAITSGFLDILDRDDANGVDTKNIIELSVSLKVKNYLLSIIKVDEVKELDYKLDGEPELVVDDEVPVSEETT